MGIEQVSHVFRELGIDYGLEQHDIANMKIHHTYSPSKNYCMTEMKIPAIHRMMTTNAFDRIIESISAPSLHGLLYKSVSNDDFYNLINSESIDKVRRYEEDTAYTFYFSNTRQLKLYNHDYMMAAMVYLNYPIRSFARRTPCAKIDPECLTCWDVLAMPVRNYLDEGSEDFNATFEKYFFTNIEEKHRLLMAYTIEKKKKPGECFTTQEPEYFIQEMSVPYFEEAISRKSVFQNSVIQERRVENKDMYVLTESEMTIVLQTPDESFTYESYVGGAGRSGGAKYNIFNGSNVPEDLHIALNNNDFEKLWKFDFKNMNTRNTIHKYQYNHWAFYCTRADDGLWCSWDASEIIDTGAASVSSSYSSEAGQITGQLNQVAGMFGWGATNDTSSHDTVFSFLAEKIDSIDYVDVIEPLPGRKLSLF